MIRLNLFLMLDNFLDKLDLAIKEKTLTKNQEFYKCGRF